MPRTPEQVVWDFVQIWFAKAETDLRVAAHILDMEMTDYASAAFHAQQSAEKYLKAFLVRHQIAFPKTHYLEDLLDLAAEKDKSLALELTFAASLTPFAVEFRYPGAEDVYLEMATQAVQDATRVEAAVLERLSDYLAGGRPV